MSSAASLNLAQSQNGVLGNGLKVAELVPDKEENNEEKEKMLVTSIFSFSHNVLNPIKEIHVYVFIHWSFIYIVVCKCFEFEHA